MTLGLITPVLNFGAEPHLNSSAHPAEIEAEPLHAIRLRNEFVSIYEAVIPAGQLTLWHTHRQSGVGVDLTVARLAIEKVGARRVEDEAKPGDIFAVDASTPYTHRLENIGATPYRVIVVEVLRSPGDQSIVSNLENAAGYKLELENKRVRVHRLILAPGAATALHTLQANSLSLSISGGQIWIASPQTPGRFAAVAPGSFEWRAQPATVTIKNIGPAPYEAMLMELKANTL